MYSPLSSWASVEEPEYDRWAGYDLPAVIVANGDESEEDFDEDDFDDDFDDEFEEEDDFEDDSPEEEMDEPDLQPL